MKITLAKYRIVCVLSNIAQACRINSCHENKRKRGRLHLNKLPHVWPADAILSNYRITINLVVLKDLEQSSVNGRNIA
jgi:hypothetical protein